MIIIEAPIAVRFHTAAAIRSAAAPSPRTLSLTSLFFSSSIYFRWLGLALILTYGMWCCEKFRRLFRNKKRRRFAVFEWTNSSCCCAFVHWLVCTFWQIITVQCGAPMTWTVCVMPLRAGSHAAAVSTRLGMPVLLSSCSCDYLLWHKEVCLMIMERNCGKFIVLRSQKL